MLRTTHHPTTRAHRLSAVVVCTLAFLVGTMIGAHPRSAKAATAATGSYYWVHMNGGDGFVNYDHLSQSAQSGNVDWPVTLFFYYTASISKVKNALHPAFSDTGGTMYGRLQDATTIVWDQDNGTKNPTGSCPVDIHERIYADSDDRMYNPVDGFYVYATSHRDVYENCSGEWFGDSEYAATQFYLQYTSRGYTGTQNAVGISNVEPARWQGTHYWSNDGNMTKIKIT